MTGFVALDLSKASTGWALYEHGSDRAHYGHWQLGSEYTPDGGVFCKLHQCLSDLHSLNKFDHLYFEDTLPPVKLQGFTNINSIRLAAGLSSHAESWGEALGMRTIQRVNLESWRPEFIGRVVSQQAKRDARNKSKQLDKKVSARGTLKALTIARCKQLGWTPRNDDEADALGILDYVLTLHQIIPPWRKDEVLRPPLEVV